MCNTHSALHSISPHPLSCQASNHLAMWFCGMHWYTCGVHYVVHVLCIMCNVQNALCIVQPLSPPAPVSSVRLKVITSCASSTYLFSHSKCQQCHAKSQQSPSKAPNFQTNRRFQDNCLFGFWAGLDLNLLPQGSPLLRSVIKSGRLDSQFLDTQVSLEPTHVQYNLAEPNITLQNRI